MEPNKRGQLKLFFGYADGVGTTDAMLQAVRTAKSAGLDAAVGFVNPDSLYHSAADADLLNHREFDLNAALAQHPQWIAVDELAHTNAEGARNANRYQDVEELLSAGINVWSTIRVQDIESLNDMVSGILGIEVTARIPDSVFDRADEVELIDLDPQELQKRRTTGLSVSDLSALREMALRRMADRVDLLVEKARRKKQEEYPSAEHILVCLSPAPSNAKIIRTAARMAGAFHGAFTALFVETHAFSVMTETDRNRLRSNMRLAQQLGAKIETVYGDNVPYQIAEFARVSGASKVIIGSRTATRRGFWSKPSLTEELIHLAPNLDVHIIPDAASKKRIEESFPIPRKIGFSPEDILRSLAILLLTTAVCFLFFRFGFEESNIIMVYILGVLITSVVTNRRIYSLVSAALSVLLFNFLFTYPQYTFHAYGKGYPVTFLVMFLVAFISGTLAVKLKQHTRQSAQAAFRTEILFDTNLLLQQAKDRDQIISAAAGQLTKLLNRNLVIYPASHGALEAPRAFVVSPVSGTDWYTADKEREAAQWVLKNNKHAGATTNTLSSAKCLYMALRADDAVYGVVGIAAGPVPMTVFENGVLLSILSACALALENEKNAREKEEAALAAQNEQLRANLLRSISHDLRTPLTSISGNASNLISNEGKFDAGTKMQIYMDIYDDSMWLINLVENLLSISRIDEGRMNLNCSVELMDDVIAEALHHIDRRSKEHVIQVRSSEEMVLARMDSRLIVQVLINLVDNAIKYTPAGSEIVVSSETDGKTVFVSVADNGSGIPDTMKPRVFDMFYSGSNKIADNRRSLGLGLALCKAIVTAHGGQITVSDNMPHGAKFTFTLPAGEVELHE